MPWSAYGVSLLGVAALFQIADTSQVVGAGLLRGNQGHEGADDDCDWLVCCHRDPGRLGAWRSRLALAGVGVWLGLAVGLFLAGGLMNARFFRMIR